MLFKWLAVLVFACTVSAVALSSQINYGNGYLACVSKIKDFPWEAYDSCKRYLAEQSEHSSYVVAWVADYEKALPYIHFLKKLASSENAPWFVYGPDLQIDLPETTDTRGPFQITIARAIKSPHEAAMLRRAEAVYESPSSMVKRASGSLRTFADYPDAKMEPLWGDGPSVSGEPSSGEQVTHIVTARSVRYYYDLSLAERKDPHMPDGFTAITSEMNYRAAIQRFSNYAHNGQKFKNVYVADMTLGWEFVCGDLCGVTFTRNKVVVLDDKANVIAMFLDAPVNRWIGVS